MLTNVSKMLSQLFIHLNIRKFQRFGSIKLKDKKCQYKAIIESEKYEYELLYRKQYIIFKFWSRQKLI